MRGSRLLTTSGHTIKTAAHLSPFFSPPLPPGFGKENDKEKEQQKEKGG